MPIKDETGNIYGRLTVIKKDGKCKGGHITWFCECECGNIISVRGCDLRKGHTKSCGCYRSEKTKKRVAIDEKGNKYGNSC